MRTEIFYDPVRPETNIVIDGERVDSADIYGFLYPVRRFVLQTWLNESSSWSGLVQHLSVLARGRDMDAVFHGRETDYDDFYAAAGGRFRCSFEKWDSDELCDRRIEKAQQILDTIIGGYMKMESDSCDVKKNFGDIFPEKAEKLGKVLSSSADNKWLLEIKSKADFEEASGMFGNCCLIDETFLYSFEQFSKLEALFGSLRRAQDMLVCEFSSKKRLEEYRVYNSQVAKYGVRFVLKGESVEDELYEKYGKPYLKRQQFKTLDKARCLLKECFKMKKSLETQLKSQEKRTDTESIRERLAAENKKRWIIHEQKRFDELEMLLDSDLL